MKEILLIIIYRAKVNLQIKVAINIQASGKIIKETVKENMFMLTVTYMMVIGLMMKKKVMACIHLAMEISMKAILKKVKKKGKGNIILLTVRK